MLKSQPELPVRTVEEIEIELLRCRCYSRVSGSPTVRRSSRQVRNSQVIHTHRNNIVIMD